MANEGSTKPTYSELVRALDIMTEKYKAEYGYVESAREERDQITKTCDLLRAENLCVRGLLQRQWVSVEERLPGQVGNYLASSTMFRGETVGKDVAELSWDGSEWRRLRDLLPMSTFGSKVTHWRELPEPPQGAESADIGKLDTADEIDEQFKGMATDEKYQAVTKELLGSAETGGEKAAPLKRYCGDKHLAMQPNGHCLNCGETERTSCDHPHLDRIDQATGPDKVWECQACKGLFREVKDGIYTKWIATFPRSSQNQTAASGVEGAHEGTTADKSELLPTQLPKEK